VIAAGQLVVPPAGFEPALPPPEGGRSRDRPRLPASYLGFLFALCVSGDFQCPVVRSTSHPKTEIVSGPLELGLQRQLDASLAADGPRYTDINPTLPECGAGMGKMGR
jgi:hypothetical protein